MSPSIQVLKLIEGMCSCSNNRMKMFELDPFSHKPRPIWRSSDQAPGEVSGLDGAPQSQTSWLCIQTQIWSLLKEVYKGPRSLHKLTFQMKMLTLSSSSPGPLTYSMSCLLHLTDINPCAQPPGLTGEECLLMEWKCWLNIWATCQMSTKWDGEGRAL